MRFYLSGTDFFHRVRGWFGFSKPEYLGFDEWDIWKDKTRKEHPVGYWLTEDLPRHMDWLLESITDIYYKPRYYIRNRFIRKTHYLRTDVEPGTYSDLDNRIQSALMFAVIDFVEIELAYKSHWCVTEESKTAVWRDGRCPELGLAYLRWEMSLVNDKHAGFSEEDVGYMEPSHQARAAQEIHKLYVWCKHMRPNREDAYDLSGWTAICEEGREKNYGWTYSRAPEEFIQRKNASHILLDQIQKQYDDEDDQMLERIIKIRRSLWA